MKEHSHEIDGLEAPVQAARISRRSLLEYAGSFNGHVIAACLPSAS